MTTQFIRDLHQFALAVDIVSTELLQEVGKLLDDYFRKTLRTGTYEVRIEAPPGTDGERFLATLWSSDGKKYTAPLHKADGSIRGHTSYAVQFDKPLWITVADGSESLLQATSYCEMWSGADDLPAYRDWAGEPFLTSVIVPIGRPASGFLNLEFEQHLDLCSGAKAELLHVAKIIEIFCRSHDSHRAQLDNTHNAFQNLNAKIIQSPLLKPKLFLAFSSRADAEVVGAVKTILAERSADFDVVSWDEMHESGNVNAQIADAISSAAFGVCYMSEPAGANGRFQDNPNVVFEAGMFHAMNAADVGGTLWVPIREECSGPPPFDFAAERLLVVPRGKGGKLNKRALTANLRNRVNSLLESR